MSDHRLWHVAVLASTLFAAAGAAILALTPLLFDDPPPGLRRARPIALVVIGLAAVLLVVEWTAVH